MITGVDELKMKLRDALIAHHDDFVGSPTNVYLRLRLLEPIATLNSPLPCGFVEPLYKLRQNQESEETRRCRYLLLSILSVAKRKLGRSFKRSGFACA